MKTFETEKHNIPEGATHYLNEGSCLCFAWFKDVGGVKYLWTPGRIECWQVMQHQDDFYAIGVKPIPTTEPKYRYEKVEGVVSGECLYVKCDDEYTGCIVICLHPHRPEIIVETDEMIGTATLEDLYRRIEVTERELFIEVMHKKGSDSGMELCKEHLGWQFDVGCRFVNGKG